MMPGSDSKARLAPATNLQNTKSFADVAMERGYCTVDQISKARAKQRESGAKELSAVLIEMGFVTKDQAHACNRAVSGKTVIGNFEILEKVGQGGMGAVFRARQITMDRIVALKILPPKLAQNPSFQKRFINEARVSAKLSHLNIINGIDCGEANGYTYFAMEFVEGRTIKEVMKEKGKFAPREATKIIRQVVEALAYAKSQGMVHRDVKPDNIMLTANGVAKLCDLGLAKHIESNDDANLTQSGQAVGTPHYISPEQARGEPVDFNSDIYSLGATFYHMLTGKTPFNAPTSAAVMALHIANDTRSPCDTDPTVPVAYGQVISKMMAKEQAERYPTPDGLFEDLDALETGKTPSAANFKGKTSCLMPKAGGPGTKSLRGRTTGPVAPVEERTSTSARLPRTTARSAGMGWVPVAALAAVVLVVVYFAAGNHSTPPNQTNIAKASPAPIHNDPQKEIKPPEPPSNTETKTAAANPNSTATATGTAQPPTVVEPKVEPKTKPDETVAIKEPPVEHESPKLPPPTPPVEVAQPVKNVDPTPKTEPAVAVKFEPSADMQYARLLSELLKRTVNADLAKVLPEIKKVTSEAAFVKIRLEAQLEVDGVNDSIKFEHDAMAALAKRGGEIELNGPKALAKKGTIVNFDSEHGLIVKVSDGLEITLKAADVGVDQILAANADAPVVKRLEYLLVRGRVATGALKPLVDKLDGNDKAVWERKLRLLVEADRDIKAREHYEAIEKALAAKDWKQLDAQITEFEKAYSTTEVAQENATTIAGWQAQARKELQPANPWKKFFHCTTSRDLPDGWVELTYDFEKTPDAFNDFLGLPNNAVIGDQHLIVDKNEEGRFDQIYFNTPLAELKLVSFMLKIPAQLRKGGCRLGFQNPDGKFLTSLVDINTRNGLNIPNAVGPTSKLTWGDFNLGEDVEFSGKSNDGKTFAWTLAGKELGTSTVTEISGKRIGVACLQFHNSWAQFKIVFKPDLKWLQEKTEGSQKK